MRYDHGTAWSVDKQNIVYYGSIAAVGAGAPWLGKDDALGETLWRSVGAMVAGGACTQAQNGPFFASALPHRRPWPLVRGSTKPWRA